MRNMIEKTHHLFTRPYVCLPLYLLQEMLELAVKYNKAVQEEDQLSPEKLAIANVGRQDAKKHLEEHVSNLMSSNIVQTLGTMLDTVVF
jgi:26S proteasome regulatory subunit N11